MSPVNSDDLTHIVEQHGDRFVALRSPEGAEHSPDYFELASFSTRSEAENYLTHRMGSFSQLIDLGKFM